MYDYRPLSELPPPRAHRFRAFLKRNGLFLLAAAVFVIVAALAFWEGPVPTNPSGEEWAETPGAISGVPGGMSGGRDEGAGVVDTGISVVTSPTGADIAVEFDPVGVSPLDPVPLDAGSYFVSISKEGYTPLDTLVFVDNGRLTPVYVVLRPADALASARPDPRRAAEQARPVAPPARREASPRASTEPAPRATAPPRTAPRDQAQEPARRASAAPLRRTEPASTGSVTVRSEPSGATVLLNGQPLGTTPTTLYRVTPDAYTLSLELSGFATHSERVDIRAGEQAEVRAALVSSAGAVEVLVRPWGSIYIDGKLHRADTDVAYRTQVPAGTHTIRVTHPSLGSQEQAVDVAAGGVKRVVIDLNENR